MVLALCVTVHLATIIVAVRGGLSADEILMRTRDSVGWGLFYTVFVVAVAIHAPIGLRTILSEWAGASGRAMDALLLALALGLTVLGMRAVIAVTVRA